MEFGDTQTYKTSKEAQKIQSEVSHKNDQIKYFSRHVLFCAERQKEYRRDFEEQVKGRALLDVDQTPGYLTARHASALLSEVPEPPRHLGFCKT